MTSNDNNINNSHNSSNNNHNKNNSDPHLVETSSDEESPSFHSPQHTSNRGNNNNNNNNTGNNNNNNYNSGTYGHRGTDGFHCLDLSKIDQLYDGIVTAGGASTVETGVDASSSAAPPGLSLPALTTTSPGMKRMRKAHAEIRSTGECYDNRSFNRSSYFNLICIWW